MRATDVTLAFADHLLEALAAMRSASIGVGREGALTPLAFTTAQGRRLRELTLPGLGTAQLHGVGCLIEFFSGAEVDFDWDRDGVVIFDAGRLLGFAHSIGEVSVSRQDVVDAVSLDSRFLEIRPGWFSLTLLVTHE